MTSPFEAGRAIGSNISSAFEKSRDMTNIQDILAQAAKYNNSPEAQQTAIQRILGQVSESRQPNVMQLLQNQGQLQQQQRSIQALSGLTGIPQEQLQGLSPKEREIVLANKMKATAKTGFQPNKPLIQNAFNRVDELVKKGKTGMTLESFSPEGRQDRAELNGLGEIFIANLIPMINPKGTMSESRFKYIKSLAPTGHDTDETIRGKVKSLKTLFEMDPSQLSALETMPDNQFKWSLKTGNIPQVQQEPQGISDDQIDALLQQTGGDIEAAINILQGMQ
jgi:hypothetical protein